MGIVVVGRWDTVQYLSIADDGYIYGRFGGLANRGPDDWCGNSGGFPGYACHVRAALMVAVPVV